MRVERSTTSTVGREAELATLLAAARSAATRMLLVSGDAGVGKTRVVEETLLALREEGWRVLVGHCLDLGEASVPYLPLAEVVDALPTASVDGSPDRLPAGLAEGLSGLGRGGAPGSADGPRGRAEVLDAVLALVESVGRDAPLALVLEDVHWADPSTRDLVGFLLARRLSGRVLLVLTYRADELHRRHPLRPRLAEWLRLAGVERVALEPLPGSAVRDLVAALVSGHGDGPAPPETDLARVVARAQGNAFYVEELVGALVDGGGRLPDDLADLLLVRLDRLGERAREVVRVASAAGQRVSHDLLARVLDLDERDLEAALREAVDARVLVRSGATAYAFRHALLGEAVHDDLLPGERARLHTAYAAAVRDSPDATAADLARHALASHDLATALTASVAAGEAALAGGGPDEAAQHFGTALEIHARGAAGLDDPPEPTVLVGRASEALTEAGRPDAALALVDDHLRRLAGDAPPVARARLLLARFEALRATEADARPSRVTAEGLALVGVDPTPLRARLLAGHAHALVWDDDLAGAAAAAEQAIAMAEALGLDAVATDAGLTLTWLGHEGALGPGQDDGVVDRLRGLVDQARSRGDLAGELRGHLRLGAVALDHGRLPEAQRAYLDAWHRAVAAGRPWTNYGIAGRTTAAVVAVVRGRWEEALALVDHRREDPPPVSRALLDGVRLAVAAGRGEVGALDVLPALRERWRREGLIAVHGGGAALDLLGRRDGAEAAVAGYDDVCDALAPTWGRSFGARLRLAASALAVLADHAATTPSDARDAVRATGVRLREDGEQVVHAHRQRGFGPEGRAWQARLHAESLRLAWQLGDPVDRAALVGAWRDAVAGFEQYGQVAEVARTRARLAAVLRPGGTPGEVEEARALVEQARAAATELGAVPLLEELGTAGRPVAAGLTPREAEVLALVAEGRSNAEIAGRLFISAKTVSVHLSNLMAKLGAASRTEAVAVARRTHLLG
ncbi:helix-turn-helix transcriptional regulator [Nocardioides aurantiacus]|uniref:helix-turn-helix transcriptional regulator n=1 Tax=Nocardioides aurantiacus TaxID=86796 RepID=UPI00403F03BD